MHDIDSIYHNTFGVAFYWKKNEVTHIEKIQFIFRDTGLLISKKELLQFSKHILCSKEQGKGCKDCPQNESCRSWLVDTPAPQVTFAMNFKELEALQDLVEGTLFQLNLNTILGEVL